MKKFIILVPARTGSTMLLGRLRSHPDMFVQAELLNQKAVHALSRSQRIWMGVAGKIGLTRESANLQFDGHNFMAVVNNLAWGRQYRHFEAAGFKIIWEQWLALSPGQRTRFLNEHVPQVIWLTRKDVLSHFVSTAQAVQNGYRHRLQGQPPLQLPPVRVTLDDVRAFHRHNFAQESLLRFQFSRFESFETSYESLVANPEIENRRLLEFLGVRTVPLTERLAKNSNTDLRTKIDNFDAFAKSLRGTSYEHLLPGEL
jgi:LPS sulfotransferase NodH